VDWEGLWNIDKGAVFAKAVYHTSRGCELISWDLHDSKCDCADNDIYMDATMRQILPLPLCTAIARHLEGRDPIHVLGGIASHSLRQGSSSLTSSMNITKRLIHRDLVVRLSSLFCSQSIISQHCSEQHLSSVPTILRTTILCRIMAHSISTRHEDPALMVSRSSIRVNWNSHRCRCPSGGINTEIESENIIRLTGRSTSLSCPAPEVIRCT
jgi:hypothetical protein